MIEYGHRNLAIVSGICEGNDRAADRLAGMKQAIGAEGIDLKQVTVLQTKYSFEHAARAFDTIIAQSPRPTAILAGNDVLAVGLIERARSLGFSVPGDLSVTGFDDISVCLLYTSPSPRD